MNKTPIFKGVGTALVSPFNKNGSLDLVSFRRLVEFQVHNGIDALIVGGTTGESPTLDITEFTLLLSSAIENKGNAKVIAGIGKNDTRVSVALAKHAQKMGADAVMAVAPYYNRPPQEGLIAHFKAIAGAVDLPVMLYNVPTRTGINLDADSCFELSKIDNIVALKEAGGNFSQTLKVRALCNDDLFLYSGNDDQITAMMALGAVGVVSVVANAYPKEIKSIVNAALKNKFLLSTKQQCKLLPIIEKAFSKTNPIPIKAMLEEKGICQKWVRLPLIAMPNSELENS